MASIEPRTCNATRIKTSSTTTAQIIWRFGGLLGLLASVAVLFAFTPARADVASVLPAFYAEPGSHDKWRQKVSGINEQVDPFGGSLQVGHTDMVVPGNGGLDIVIQRHYSSNIFLSRPSPLTTPPYPSTLLSQSPAGMGWTMHFGRAVKSESDNRLHNHICVTDYDPNLGDTTLDDGVLELPDGSMDTLTTSLTGIALFATRKNWLANCTPSGDGLIVFAPNGLKYTMNHVVQALDDVTYTGRLTRAWHTTRIEDPNGNYINISYSGQRGSYALISQITSSDGRIVNFGYTDGYVTSISSKDTNDTVNQLWTYEYTTIGMRTYLTRVTRPDGLTWQYEYYPYESEIDYVLRKVTYPYGATVSYTYGYADFMGDPARQGWDNSGKMYSIVVTSKTQAGRGIEPGTWTYTYAPETDASIEPGLLNDVTTVDFPGGRYVYRHYGVRRQLQIIGTIADRQIWKTGLLAKKETYALNISSEYELVQSESYDWIAPGAISDQKNAALVYPTIDQNVYYPQLAKKTIVRDGTTYVTEYTYEDIASGFADTRPIKTVETGQQGSIFGNQAARTTDLIWYPANPTAVWKFDQVQHEVVNGSNYFGTLRDFDYSNGNMTAYQVHGVPENYNYDANGNLTLKTNPRGARTTYGNYHRGVPRTETHEVYSDEWISISRVVNDTGTVRSETNGRNYATSYQYDGLNRVTSIDKPIGADTTAGWDTTGRTVVRDNYRERTEFDGFGRTICVEAQDTVRNERVIQVTRYDALGRKSFVSLPFNELSPEVFNAQCAAAFEGPPAPIGTGDTIVSDVLGRITRVTHPDNTSVTTRYLEGNRVQVTNERNQVTTYTYRAFGDPDKTDDRVVMRIDAPEGVSTVFTRNVIGQIQTATQGNVDGVVTRTYTYDPNRNFLLTETNPEIGTTTYTRDEIGNMTSRTVNGSPVTTYAYDGLDRLRTVDFPGTVPDVTLTYDGNSNVLTSRGRYLVPPSTDGENFSAARTYTYDENDNLKTESLQISRWLTILGQINPTDDRTLALQYDYNARDQLSSITYPKLGIVNVDPDAFGRTRQIGSLIPQVAYHPNGQPSSIQYANGRTTTFELNNRQWTSRIVTDSATVDLRYQYDGRGNVNSITDAIDPQFNRGLDYDGLDRLRIANGIWGNGTISYDAVGNIRNKTLGIDALTYSYDGANRLTGITGTRNYTFTYDVYGNVSGNSRNAFSYNDAGNLTSVTGGSSAVYHYDAKNLRVREEKNSGVTYYLYGKNGQLFGEYNRDNQNIYKEYTYLGGKLIAAAANVPLIANAGQNQTVNPATTVTLDGTASSGEIATYQWVQTAGTPVVTLNNANTAQASFVAPASATTLTFQLTVADSHNTTSSSSVTVTVRSMPIAVAGSPQTVDEGAFVQLDGSGSSAPSGTITSYRWTQLSGPSVVLSGADGAKPMFVAPQVNSNTMLTMQLTVTDSNGNSATSTVTVTVNDVVRKAVPTGLTATPGSGQATLRWTPVTTDGAGNSTYNIYWSTSPGVTTRSTKIAAVTSPFVHSGLTNGTTYYYAVTVVNTVGESSLSSEVAVKPGATQWSTAVLMPNSTSDYVTYYDDAMNANGESMVVWQQYIAVTNTLMMWARRYDPVSGWQDAIPLSTWPNQTGTNSVVQVALDNNGNAVAVWEANNTIVAAHFTRSGGWQAPRSISNNTAATRRLREQSDRYVAMDANGNAVVAWFELRRSGVGRYFDVVQANRYVASSDTWSGPVTIDDSLLASYVVTADLRGMKVAMNAAGNAVIAWGNNHTSSSSQYTYVYARRYDSVSNTWVSNQTLSSTTWSYFNGTAIDTTGNIFATWSQTPGGANYDLRARRYDSGLNVWSNSSVVLSPRNLSRLTLDANGGGFLITGNDATGDGDYLTLYGSAVTGTGTSIAAPTVIANLQPNNSVQQIGLVPAVDDSGKVMLMWSHTEPANNVDGVWYMGYVPGQGWKTPQSLVSCDYSVEYCSGVQLAAAGDGHAIAVWTHTDMVDQAYSRLYARAYTVLPNQPPTANAGNAQTVSVGATVTLSGSGTDSDGTITSYRWAQTAGPTVTLANPNAASTTFVAPTVTGDTVLTFQLTVTDDQGVTGTASVNITVTNIVAGKDLIMNAVSTTATQLNVGSTFVITNTVKNQGATSITKSFSVGLYLSTDPTITTGDTLLATRTVSSLASGAVSSADTTVTLPANIAPGTYYIGAIADRTNTQAESNENNNAMAGGTITAVRAIDLTPTAISTTATTVNLGQSFAISNTVINQGTTATNGNVTIGLYLSTDPTITTSDTLLTTRSVSLAGGASSSANTSVTVPANLALGTYYIGVIADSTNTQIETDETNNALVGTTVQVLSPIDLTMTALSTTTTSINRGSKMTVTNTVKNNGTGAAGSFQVRLYLSTDSDITTSDIVLGTRSITSLAAGASNSANTQVTIPTGVAPGTYYIGAIADHANTQVESNETNNSRTATTTIQVN